MEKADARLFDYLRLLWKGKWLILLCVALSLGGAAALLWTQEVVHQGSLKMEWEETLASLLRVTQASYLASGQVTQALPKALDRVSGASYAIQDSGKTVVFTVRGTMTPEAIASTVEGIPSRLGEALVEEIQRLIFFVEQTAQQKVDQLQEQLDVLLGRVDASVSESFSEYLITSAAALEVRISQETALLNTLRDSEPNDFFTLREVSRGPVQRIVQDRKNRLIVAAILGLLIGISLMLLVGYVRAVRGPRRGKKTAAR